MSADNRVIWSQGLFLQPQHFQQQERFVERYVQSRCQHLVPYSWGFTEIEFERDLLKLGKAGLRRLAGVFSDGTPFRMPDDDPLPPPIDVGPNVRDQILYLAVPLRRYGQPDVDRDHGDELVRYDVRELETRDGTSNGGDPAMIEVGALRTRLMFAGDATEAYSCLPLAQVVECRADKQIVLDDEFIPTTLHVRTAVRLAAFTTELVGVLHQRGDALAGQVAATGRGGAAETAAFLRLLAINRYEPLLAHFAESGEVHPERLFGVLLSAAGELATFTTPRRPGKTPAYYHDRLRDSFEPVMLELRRLLGEEIIQNAVSIPIQPRKFGVNVAIVNDRSLYSSAVFILAARADVPAEELRRRFPMQLKVGPVEKIGDLVRLSLSGVPVRAVPVAPPQLPYHAGFAYFELDQTNDLWEQLKTSGGIAVHVAGEFPGLALEFWAIRSSSQV